METNSKPGVTNYFKQVTDFGKNVFTAELKNTGATYTIFAEITASVSSTKQVFRTLQECDAQASYRFYGMAEVFDAYSIPWDTMEVGCKDQEEY